jgi:hypothetical protein
LLLLDRTTAELANLSDVFQLPEIVGNSRQLVLPRSQFIISHIAAPARLYHQPNRLVFYSLLANRRARAWPLRRCVAAIAALSAHHG